MLAPVVPASRAWIYVLSVAALLVPAAGIAYLGAVSYRDDRGAINGQIERQRLVAQHIADGIAGSIGTALAEVEAATLAKPMPGVVHSGLARHWFWIDADDHLRVPRAAPVAFELGGPLDRETCRDSTRLEECVKELSTRQARLARLPLARRAESASAWADARRQYTGLAAFDDTAPEALLGLARVLPRLGEAARVPAVLDELARRFGERTFDGVPIHVAVAALRAEAGGASAQLDLADRVLAGELQIDPIVQLGILARVRAASSRDARSAADQRRLAALDERTRALQTEARTAAGLADDLPSIVKSAAVAWTGRPATRDPARTLIYRRTQAGGIVGIAVDAPMLEAVIGAAPRDEVSVHARPRVLAAGASPGPDLRKLVEVPLGAALPHLQLVIVNPVMEPDPLDEIIRERSRRHVMYTSALALALGLGLLATIRGALRARDLARLKSDFVSTVSHELKTPLTSIRMFAEMLEQGVARGDPAKMARYHGVIVQESQRLGLLIANLLDYSQIERGTRRYTRARQPLESLARHAIATFELLREGDGRVPGVRNPVVVEVSPEAMIASVEVDRDVVVQALLNLLANAAKYGGVERAIEVVVEADATTAWIAVRDHGPGIPASEQARIFREFYRAPEAYRSNVEGTGLGLALVKRHVEALGGTVGVVSAVGEGATFTVRLPRVGAARLDADELPDGEVLA